MNIFNNLLERTNFTSVLETECADLANNKFMNLYTEAYNLAFPMKTSIIPNKYIKKSPWITKGLIQSAIRKFKLLKKTLKNPTETNINTYKIYNFTYNKLLRIAKKTYFNNQIELTKGNMKKTWSTLRNVLNHNQCKSPFPDHFIYDNNKITHTKEIAQSFNNFFANIGKNISSKVPTSQFHYTHYLNRQHDSSIFLDPVTPAGIINFTSKIKAKSSQGHDGISSKLIKESIHHIATPFTHIVNQSLSTGVVPINMKLERSYQFLNPETSIFSITTNQYSASFLKDFRKNIGQE